MNHRPINRLGGCLFVCLAAWLPAQSPPPSAATLQADQKFALVLPDFSAVEFSQSGVIHLPNGRTKLLEFRIGKPASDRLDPGAISVEIDQSPAEPEIVTADTMIVRVRATDSPDLLPPGLPHRVTLKVRKHPEYSNSWILEHADDLWLTEAAGDDEGVPLEIKLARPALPLLASPSKPLPLTVQGTVNRTQATVLVNGTAAALTPLNDGLSSQFSLALTLPTTVRELVIEATGTKGDTARSIAPIRRIGR